ncbi:putative protein/nucleic acid deglycase DJ-1, class I glutamine amidotransferase [Helianthus annuus]|uniref:Putative DJ-1, Class I glutamine amidotransferase-like protein n=1 Tax=Helianthus annuus TaxID=4232 RepID=A0A251UVS6_HELAN|nr:protein DJ-1 homolog B [Helianthus annuus]KAF5808557.1 putative protein/nucleic acid deglycase DJ-1, class I glutamine amidotransferase [Helianthus annuus]KAJ0586991.1 putative protein/nucleic acid deglycase DJ-1, class I glutamine amidotransferase [Helianthus annuus]KAJ0925199.1 putative protein/nucleic acid deglycase DJ-1, class I glutamine amidotransferase [Helianthus annuus]
MVLKKVLVPVAVGTEPMEAVIVIDVLRRAGADVTVASVTSQLCVDAARGVTIVADALISACVDTVFDLISIPGGMLGTVNLRTNMTLWRMLRDHVEEGRIYGALSEAPAFLLGKWGFLWNLKATCAPSSMGTLSSYAIAVDSRLQLDGKAVTSQGLGTTMEYALALVEQLFGTEKADELSGLRLMPFEPNNTFFHTWPQNLFQRTCGTRRPKVLLSIVDGLEEMEAVMIIDVLRRAKAEVVVASAADKREVMASRKVRLVADMLHSDAVEQSYDLIMWLGVLGFARARAVEDSDDEALPHELLKVSPFTGLCETPSSVMVAGKVIISRGLGTTLLFSLTIVDLLLGREKALEIAKLMLVENFH